LTSTIHAVSDPSTLEHSKKPLKNQQLQYMGFVTVPDGREYNFRFAVQGQPDRSFIMVIDSAGFLSGKIKYQEGPGIGYWKLIGALATEVSELPLANRQRVTEAEMADYTASSGGKKKSWTEERRADASKRFREQLAERRARG
jgi:hypothetical protein